MVKNPRLTLSISPSFEDRVVVSLLEHRKTNEHTYWIRYQETAPPTTDPLESVEQRFSVTEECEIFEGDAADLLEKLKEVSISVAPEYIVGCDGTTYELIVDSGFNRVHYQWWSEIPKGWEALIDASNALLKLAGKPGIDQHFSR